MSRWRLALLLLAGVVYAGASHWMMVWHPTAPWAVVVLLGPLWLTGLGLAASRFGKWGVVLAVLIGVAGFAAIIRGHAGNPDRLYVFQHAAMNALLCIWFGATLRPGGLSLIGQFAQRIHPLTATMRSYTVQVTRIWTAYFALTVVCSIAVYFTFSFAAWSFLANIVSPLCVAGIFIGEYLLRYKLHPEFERTRLIDAVRAFYDAPADRGAGH